MSRPIVAALTADLGDALEVRDLYGAGGADVYEALSSDDKAELAEFVSVMRGRRTAVLELGCGWGRLTVPLLTLGFPVVGVDLSSSMLAILAARASGLPTRMREQLELVEGDMASLRLPRRFGAVLLAATTVSLLDEAGRRATFRLAAEHLEPDGCFVVSNLELAGELEGENVQVTVRRLPTIGAAVITMIEHINHEREHRDVGVLVQTLDRTHPLTLYRSRPRIVAREDLLEDLADAGMEVVHELARPDDRRRRTVCLHVCRRTVAA